jgi:arylformamidase
MQIFDISMKIFHEMPVYKGKEAKRPLLTVVSDFSTGTAYETKLEMNLHTGTHLDRSLHMMEGGSTVESLDLSKVVTKCTVLDFVEVEEKITEEDLKTKNIQDGDFILLKTKNSYENILEGDFIYLEGTGAAFLKEKKVKGVGIDSLGIERNQPGHPTHKTLLGNDIVILEGLVLKDIQEGEYLLVAAPILVCGAEAAPIRALLLKDV